MSFWIMPSCIVFDFHDDAAFHYQIHLPPAHTFAVKSLDHGHFRADGEAARNQFISQRFAFLVLQKAVVRFEFLEQLSESAARFWR